MPLLVVSTVGTSRLGSIDNIDAIVTIAHKYSVWVHADAASGGLFMVTKHGTEKLKGRFWISEGCISDYRRN